ncbi:SPOR domain-containing protein [Cocleimonas sp. KMM 6892]|uniref:SPOR domain-containing protein n=1 Tax=unclassified Cocleimonas TaxID=2639732 RepID=UPI002DBCEC65|nr:MULTISPECIES: SPOR domain-containing protein [unclassified Cocleimonas]MEB8431279.1 SPOR domain-containing protein [Cocleimonas sp. KMM 6892]MEC4713949.1 SPOR domain-containing protein [Cocleimonas sp. KMM 6895]MEC4743280.1 SPOR domain-containing protein [Cocleimonas sp. KMM 6896]
MSNSLIKNLIVVLLGLNVFYLIWTLTIGKSHGTPPLTEEKGVPSLTLLPIQNSDIYQSNTSTRQSSCYTFGPFNSEKTAQIIAKNINNFGLATETHKQKTMQTLNFLVYLEPLKNRSEALKVINDIKKQEVTEYKIIDTGPYKNAIALGSFDSLDEARRHSEYIRFLGYDAKYTTQKKQKEVYWIDYDEPFGSNAPVLDWANDIDPRNSAQKIPKACAF